MSKLVEAPFTDKCSVCGEIVRGKTERGLRQGMGVHKRIKHGIVGKGKARSTRADRPKVQVHEPMPLAERARKANAARWANTTPESRREFMRKVAMRRYQKKWREKKRAALEAAQVQAETLLANGQQTTPHKFVVVCPCCQTIIKTEYQKL